MAVETGNEAEADAIGVGGNDMIGIEADIGSDRQEEAPSAKKLLPPLLLFLLPEPLMDEMGDGVDCLASAAAAAAAAAQAAAACSAAKAAAWAAATSCLAFA